MDTFDKRPDVDAVFGSYDASPRIRGLVSQYRNLLHHFVHQKGNSDASTFWAGCGAVRRSVFQAIGGFDEKGFPRCIEDIELGYRLRQAQHRILLDKGLHGTHLKRWTLRSMIRTDIFCRAVPWTRLILTSGKAPRDLNLNLGQRLCVVLVGLACISLFLVPVHLGFLKLSAAAIVGVILLNRDLYRFFFRERGILFASACIPLHLLYYLYSGITFLYIWIEFQFRALIDPRFKVARRG
jgi:GT2 family glycosyltransferase